MRWTGRGPDPRFDEMLDDLERAAEYRATMVGGQAEGDHVFESGVMIVDARNALHEDRSALLSRIAELEADAARLDWLESGAAIAFGPEFERDEEGRIVGTSAPWEIELYASLENGRERCGLVNADTLRQAIDAARFC
jgi:hypothetical protein